MPEPLAARLTAALAGRYVIERELGQGGMATVYLARDLRHERQVALKVLRPELAAVIGAERFLQEIRVTAGLQHPHILPLHDSGEADHFLYYVMPFVEGESLRQRLTRERQLAIDETVRIASEAASALAYAHNRGVIHRDIKPENILIASGPGGAAVVADFGIARAVTAAGGGRLTETGLSLGTPQYMSPEQATADRELDGRSDVYALGAVVYEMLIGEPPYTGPTTQSVIAKLLTEEPRPVTAGRPSVPLHLAAAVHKALARLPADRFRTAGEFGEALTRPGMVSTAAVSRSGKSQRIATSSRAVTVLAGLALLAVGFLLGWLLAPRPDNPEPLVRSMIKLPAQAPVSGLLSGSPLALSPDGQTIVYATRERLYIRRLDQLEPTPLAGTENAVHAFFSPDGREIGFLAEGNLKRISLGGGPALTICPATFGGGASWGPDETIVFSSNFKVYQVAASGGVPRLIHLKDTTGTRANLRWPEVLPDGKRVLATAGVVRSLETVVIEIATGEVQTLEGVGSYARLVDGGTLISYSADGTALATPFDPSRGRVTGPTTPLLQGVRLALQGVAKAAVSRSGSLVYLPIAAAQGHLVLVDRHGAAKQLVTEPKRYSDPRFSPNGETIAFTSLVSGTGLAGDIWVLSLKQLVPSRLTFEVRHQFPEWTADGRRITFTAVAGRGGVLSVPASGGEIDTVIASPSGDFYEAFLTRDQQTVIYRMGGIPGDLYYARRDSLSSPHPLAASRFDERAPALAPGERWVAYVSNETGRDEVYVRPFPVGRSGARWQVSGAGGEEPRWRRDGRELFYRNADTLFAVEVLQGPGFTPGRRTALFTAGYVSNPRHATYDVHPSGNQFLFVTGQTDDATEIILVQNLVSRRSVSKP